MEQFATQEECETKYGQKLNKKLAKISDGTRIVTFVLIVAAIWAVSIGSPKPVWIIQPILTSALFFAFVWLTSLITNAVKVSWSVPRPCYIDQCGFEQSNGCIPTPNGNQFRLNEDCNPEKKDRLIVSYFSGHSSVTLCAAFFAIVIHMCTRD